MGLNYIGNEYYLMLAAIQYKEYRNLEDFEKDIITFLEFTYDRDDFYTQTLDEKLYHMGTDTDGYRAQILEDFREMIDVKKMKLYKFNMNREYLFKNRLLKKELWYGHRSKSSDWELLIHNLDDFMRDTITNWTKNKTTEWLDSLSDEERQKRFPKLPPSDEGPYPRKFKRLAVK